MTIRHYIRAAMGGVASHKSRSALTILGIVIGIMAIILVMSLGEGAQNLILGEIQGIGTKTIAVIPGRQPTGPADVIQTFGDSLKEKDLVALRRKTNVPRVSEIMPVVFGAETMAYGSDTYHPTIFGASELFARLFDIYPAKGVFFSEDDVKSRASVVIIGSKVKKELFSESDAIGENVKIKGKNFRVVGELGEGGSLSLFNFDDMAIVPYTTAQDYIFGIKYFHRFILEAESEEAVPQTVEDIKATIRNSHNIDDPSKDDFFIETQANAIERVSTVTSVLTLFLTSVAAISLVVGGIGIMNIMLVSVTERTREIGLRKALGARDKNILIQFLLEAVILTGIGGIIGIALGASLSFIASLVLSKWFALNWQFTFPVFASLLGLGISGVIGMVFGIYPARQASKKSPIEALRYE